MEITEEEAKERVVEAAIAYCDQLYAFNDPTHPEVNKHRIRLSAAVSVYLNLATSRGDGDSTEEPVSGEEK